MNERAKPERRCAICGRAFTHGLVPGSAVREAVAEEIRREHPDWTPDLHICREDLNRYRTQRVHALLASEKGDLTALEREVLSSIRDQELVSRNVEEDLEQHLSFGERLADRIADFGGSWPFLICFGIFLALWIGANSIALWWRPADPYPFILLNLILSCIAAVQAPVIMMSQNRQESKDRLRSQHDYQVNLKAELEIRHLHEKVDHLLSHQWERLAEIQEIQLEVLAELGKKS